MYDSAAMKRWLVGLLLLLLVALSTMGIRHIGKMRARKRREVAYHIALQSYQQVLKPGMTRRLVEDYFRTRNTAFRQMCCVDGNLRKHSLDDLVKIGEEEAPWFCSENNVYVAFQFSDGPGLHDKWWGSDDSDMLKSVLIYHWLENCL
jgi:hypothetical protein